MGNSTRPVRVGVDLGGTVTKIVVMRDAAEPEYFLRYDTGDHTSSDSVIQRLADQVRAALERCRASVNQCEHIGVALPGEVAVGERRLVASPILPSWHDVLIADELEELCQCPVFLHNDANAALLAENRFGAGAMTGTVALLTIGTGIGGAISFDGIIHTGSAGGAGEFGHVVVVESGPDCNCGRRGCLGVMGSTTALIRYFADEFGHPENGPPTAMEICRLLASGDVSALSAFQRFASCIARGLSDIVCVLAPDRIVLTGGLTGGLGDRLCASIRETFRVLEYPRSTRRLTIVCGRLGDKAGAIGASLGG